MKKIYLLLLLFGLVGIVAFTACANSASPNAQFNLPRDIVIPAGAKNVAVDYTDPATTKVGYISAANSVAVVASYYQQTLAQVGWQDSGTADVITDEQATLVRVNPAGDTITVNITQNGTEISVGLIVIRAGN